MPATCKATSAGDFGFNDAEMVLPPPCVPTGTTNHACIVPFTLGAISVACSGGGGQNDFTNNADFIYTVDSSKVNPPLITSKGASSICSTGATLVSTILPGNSPTTAWFRYGAPGSLSCAADTGGTKKYRQISREDDRTDKRPKIKTQI